MDIDLYEIKFDEHSLYHVSPKEFEKPTYEMIDDARTWSKTHHNSVLGLWASTLPETCSSFGPITYELKLKNPKCVGLHFDDWFELGTKIFESFEQYIELRKYILDNDLADIIYLIDASRCVNEVIIVNLDVIEKMVPVVGKTDERIKMRHFSFATTIPHRVIKQITHHSPH